MAPVSRTDVFRRAAANGIADLVLTQDGYNVFTNPDYQRRKQDLALEICAYVNERAPVPILVNQSPKFVNLLEHLKQDIRDFDPNKSTTTELMLGTYGATLEQYNNLMCQYLGRNADLISKLRERRKLELRSPSVRHASFKYA